MIPPLAFPRRSSCFRGSIQAAWSCCDHSRSHARCPVTALILSGTAYTIPPDVLIAHMAAARTPLPRLIPKMTTTSSGVMRETNMANSSLVEPVIIPHTGRTSELIQKREVLCPCWRCSRPLTLVRMVRHPSLYRLRNVIGLIGSGYGIVTMLVVLSFVLSEVQPRMSAKGVTILLFIIGSLLLIDGALSLRTAIDRTWLTTRYGLLARILGLGKTAAGVMAIGLAPFGLHL